MKKQVKILSGIFGVIFLLIAVCGIALHNQISTIASVEKVTDGLYQLTYYGDYKLESMLEADINTVEGLEEWLSDNLFFGYPISGNEYYYGCSAFLAESPDGDILMGRNYDYDKTETLILYTSPENGYASYALSDLNMLGVGGENDVKGDDLFGKISMLASPYTITEGMKKVLELQYLNLKPKKFIRITESLICFYLLR